MVVEKPPGLLIHPTRPDNETTLEGELRQMLAFEIAAGGIIGIVTRLDRETSGLVLVAKTRDSARELAGLMAGRKIRKEYLALCFGWPEESEFRVDVPLLRLGEREPFRVWLKRGAHPEGAEAVTDFEVLRRLERREDGGRFSLLRVFPQTGRTHQIRVHAAHAGFPLLGDKLYARGEDWYLSNIREGWTPAMRDALWLPRHALHASLLEWVWGDQLRSVCSNLPTDLRNLVESAA